jgi:hypothetical protein
MSERTSDELFTAKGRLREIYHLVHSSADAEELREELFDMADEDFEWLNGARIKP